MHFDCSYSSAQNLGQQMTQFPICVLIIIFYNDGLWLNRDIDQETVAPPPNKLGDNSHSCQILVMWPQIRFPGVAWDGGKGGTQNQGNGRFYFLQECSLFLLSEKLQILRARLIIWKVSRTIPPEPAGGGLHHGILNTKAEENPYARGNWHTREIRLSWAFSLWHSQPLISTLLSFCENRIFGELGRVRAAFLNSAWLDFFWATSFWPGGLLWLPQQASARLRCLMSQVSNPKVPLRREGVL